MEGHQSHIHRAFVLAIEFVIVLTVGAVVYWTLLVPSPNDVERAIAENGSVTPTGYSTEAIGNLPRAFIINP